ncbi:MAG: SIMPL domain-containing protein [Treponema sp.]|nr:SIMPL domain-containing protein [Treponema sp.]
MFGKNLKKAAGLVCSFALFSSCSIKQVNYPRRTVSVHGSGSVTLEADNATITLSVITRAAEVSAASKENAQKMTAVQDSVVSKGIAKENVTTENFSVHQENSYVNGKMIPGDYVVTNQIRIVVKDIEKVSDVIDTALANGANQLSNIQYGVMNTELAVKQARTLAVQQAIENATLIAGTSGARLGKVLEISEQQNSNFPRAMAMKTMNAAMDFAAEESVSTPISGGKTTVTVNVNATYELN